MAPTPASKSNHSTPSSKPNAAHHQSRTPQSKLRLNFPKETSAAAGAPPEHPVEVIGRIRDHPEQKSKPPDGVSLSEEDDLEGFYRKFVESRINGVKQGQKCTIMMYGPTGSGKSHTMFGSSTQQGIVYRSLKDILGGEVEGGDDEKVRVGTFVQVTVLEIYNEEIYDLLSSGNAGGGFNFGWSKGGSASKVRLEVIGKKAKNATFISGNEAGKMLKEIQKVEKRRIVKSTLCNERSSRSHCMIIVDVPTVGGRLMLVDMAGSENIEQAGQNGLEAKMQTAKINQGNIALKRVVESIANSDSHVPFRDSKLTMLLQDSFEDDKSKILMILCASPDPKELHKTIATLEYGAKAKIAALDQFICKLQIENKLREKECNEAKKELKKKEQEISALRAKLAVVGRGKEANEEEINSKIQIWLSPWIFKSMDMETTVLHKVEIHGTDPVSGFTYANNFSEGILSFPSKAGLTTVYEEEENDDEEDEKESLFDEEVQKEVIEEKRIIVAPEVSTQDPEKSDYFKDTAELGGSIV
ncbi:UNVERIFIED_CONTAM: Kinesin-like protein KIN-10A [Sesamum radiatum]|uniref:Kinesin-like protein KIN-10A n=1 Tax=Sesamum radiatum TaxID=300843 RepID=A0AAW2UBL2_SESRA